MSLSYTRHRGLSLYPKGVVRGPVTALLCCNDFEFDFWLSEKFVNKQSDSGYATRGSGRAPYRSVPESERLTETQKDILAASLSVNPNPTTKDLKILAEIFVCTKGQMQDWIQEQQAASLPPQNVVDSSNDDRVVTPASDVSKISTFDSLARERVMAFENRLRSLDKSRPLWPQLGGSRSQQRRLLLALLLQSTWALKRQVQNLSVRIRERTERAISRAQISPNPRPVRVPSRPGDVIYQPPEDGPGKKRASSSTRQSGSGDQATASKRRRGTSYTGGDSNDSSNGDSGEESLQPPKPKLGDPGLEDAKAFECQHHYHDPERYSQDVTRYQYISQLHRHLRAHGDYICHKCLAVFDSQQSMLDHRCTKACNLGGCRRHLLAGQYIPMGQQCAHITSARQQWLAVYHILYPMAGAPDNFPNGDPFTGAADTAVGDDFDLSFDDADLLGIGDILDQPTAVPAYNAPSDGPAQQSVEPPFLEATGYGFFEYDPDLDRVCAQLIEEYNDFPVDVDANANELVRAVRDEQIALREQLDRLYQLLQRDIRPATSTQPATQETTGSQVAAVELLLGALQRSSSGDFEGLNNVTRATQPSADMSPVIRIILRALQRSGSEEYEDMNGMVRGMLPDL